MIYKTLEGVLNPYGRVAHDSVALSEPIRVVDHSRLIARLGILSAQRMQQIGDALKTILEL